MLATLATLATLEKKKQAQRSKVKFIADFICFKFCATAYHPLIAFLKIIKIYKLNTLAAAFGFACCAWFYLTEFL